MGSCGIGRRRLRLYKRWRYLGVPIPRRLQGTYSDDPRKCVPRQFVDED